MEQSASADDLSCPAAGPADSPASCDRREFFKYAALMAGAASIGALGTACRQGGSSPSAESEVPTPPPQAPPGLRKMARVAADPTAIPPPISRRDPTEVAVTLEVQELLADLGNGILFEYMTFNGQVPAPLIRVREGDTLALTLRNPKTNAMAHNVDFHAALGPDGGAAATLVAPGQEARLKFKTLNPGLFIYHCAVPDLDQHISSGMHGMVLVEPAEGLPHVDHEFYLGQNEIYVKNPFGTPGYHEFDWDGLLSEKPSFIVINGEVNALTPARRGAMQVKVGQTARIFFGVGGPNLTCHLHPIGGILEEAWIQGSLRNAPLHGLQVCPVPPGSALIATLQFKIPGDVILVDHAITRAIRKGCRAVIHAEGVPNPELFNPGGVGPLT